MGAWRKRGSRDEEEAGGEATRQLLCSKREMMTACTATQANSGDYKIYLVSGCQR